MSLEMNYMAHTQELMDIVESFVNLHNQGFDINNSDVQSAVFSQYLFDELTDYDKNYIQIEVERRI